MQMEIFFILVEPAVPENIGAAARAIKTMGFSRLRLINPSGHRDERAVWLAHGSQDVLTMAEVFPGLASALHDIDFTIGTSAKPRRVKHDYHHPEELPSMILDKKDSACRVAIVFGREESGLTNKEIELCDVMARIPMKESYPSLNLAQAVMVFAYALSSISLLPILQDPSRKEEESYKAMRIKISRILSEFNIESGSALHNRILERLALLSDEDVHLVHSVCNKINERREEKGERREER